MFNPSSFLYQGLHHHKDNYNSDINSYILHHNFGDINNYNSYIYYSVDSPFSEFAGKNVTFKNMIKREGLNIILYKYNLE